MGEVCVITSGKGGVGKTTTSANVGVALAAAGERVLLVDTDIGLRNLDVALGMENRIVYDLVDVMDGRCAPDAALVTDRRYPGLWLLPAPQGSGKSAVSPADMLRLLQPLRPRFDRILVDCPAGVGQGFRNAVAGADQAVLVTVPEVSAVRDALHTAELLGGMRIPARLLVNRYRADLVRRGVMMDMASLLDILDMDLLGIVPEDVQVLAGNNLGRPAAEGRRRSAQTYARIAARLRGEAIPIPAWGRVKAAR